MLSFHLNVFLTTFTNSSVLSRFPVYNDQPISSKSPPTRDKLQPENKAQVRGRSRETDTTGKPSLLFSIYFAACRVWDAIMSQVSNPIQIIFQLQFKSSRMRALSFYQQQCIDLRKLHTTSDRRRQHNFEIPKYFSLLLPLKLPSLLLLPPISKWLEMK